jgi:mercuric ion transport protein
MKKGAFLSTGLLAAMASSLCCIAPLLAIVGGVSGGVSAFGWVEPYRPYLIGLSVVALGFAFYRAYRPAKADDCGCEVKEGRSFLNSKGFLWSVALLSALLFTFPFYADVFYPEVGVNAEAVAEEEVKEVKMTVDGMTCDACENHVNHTLLESPGVIEAFSSYSGGWASVKFDGSKTDSDELAERVEKSTGYKVSTIEKKD